MSSFDELAKVALGEGTLNDYMSVVKRASKEPIGKKMAKAAVKGAIKGAAQLPGRAIQAAGLAAKGLGKLYSAVGGTQGGALLQKAGGAVSGAGQAIAMAPEKIHDAIVNYGRSYEFKTKHLNNYKNYSIARYPRLEKQFKQAESISDIESILKKNVPGIKDSEIKKHTTDYFKDKKDPEVQSILSGQVQQTQPVQAAQPLATASVEKQFKPVLKANRSMVKDVRSGIVYRYLGKSQGGWYIYDPLTKKTDPAPIDPREQKNVTELWRKKEVSNAPRKQQPVK